MKTRPGIALVTPALADTNNGNWRTAQRWARMLATHYQVQLLPRWSGEAADVLLALHARRSAPSVAAWAGARPQRPLVLALTGTDLYRDIPEGDPDALASLAAADRLIVLHEGAVDDVPAEHRHKVLASPQSMPARVSLQDKPGTRLRAVAVGHLRAEKDPATLLAAARLLVGRSDIFIDHIGRALDPELGAAAQALAAAQSRYRWLGDQAHAATRTRIQRAHVLVHPSLMEGGAQVVIEAVVSGTPVLASRMAGNVGLLGVDYEGYFPVGDAAALAALLQRCRDDHAMLPRLAAQCARRAPLFSPAREAERLHALMQSLLETSTP